MPSHSQQLDASAYGSFDRIQEHVIMNRLLPQPSNSLLLIQIEMIGSNNAMVDVNQRISEAMRLGCRIRDSDYR